jgi:cytoskeletal protein RodZ
MGNQRRPRGNAATIVIVIVVLLAALGYWWYYSSRPNPAVNHNANTTNTNSDVPTAPSVTSEDDLTASEAALDQVDLNDTSTESSQLTTYSAEF